MFRNVNLVQYIYIFFKVICFIKQLFESSFFFIIGSQNTHLFLFEKLILALILKLIVMHNKPSVPEKVVNAFIDTTHKAYQAEHRA